MDDLPVLETIERTCWMISHTVSFLHTFSDCARLMIGFDLKKRIDIKVLFIIPVLPLVMMFPHFPNHLTDQAVTKGWSPGFD